MGMKHWTLTSTAHVFSTRDKKGTKGRNFGPEGGAEEIRVSAQLQNQETRHLYFCT